MIRKLILKFSFLKRCVHLFFLIPIFCFSQLTELNPETALKDYQLKTWEKIGDTPIERVFDITQDSLGFLWIGSDRGLLRFDGTQAEVFNLKNTPVLETESIRIVRVGKSGIVWFTTRRGLYYVKNGNVFEFRTVNQEKINRITGMHINNNGDLWFTSNYKLFSIKNFQIEEHVGFEGTPFKIFSGKNNKAWIFVNGKPGYSIYKLTAEGEIEKRLIEGGLQFAIRSLAENKNGDLYLGGINGFFYTLINDEINCYNCKKQKPEYRITDIISDANGAIWVGSNGIHKIANRSHSVLNYSNGLAGDAVLSLFKDKLGNLWVGTNSGLNYLSNSPFELYGVGNEIYEKDVKFNCVIKGKDNLIMAGSKNHGLFYLKDKKLFKFREEGGIGKEISSISKTNILNEFLVGTEKGLFKVKRNNNAITILKKINDSKIGRVYVCRNNDIWYSTFNDVNTEKLYLLKEGRIKEFEITAGAKIVWFYEDAKVGLKIGTSMGVFEYSNLAFKKDESKGLLGTKMILDFADYGDRGFWIGTYGSGIVHFSESGPREYSTKNGLPVNQAYSILSSKKLGLWYYSRDKFNGKYQRITPFLNREGDYEMGKGEVYEIKSDNFIESQLVGFPYKTEMGDGTILMVGLNGLIRFNPNSMPSLKPRLILKKIIVDGRKVDVVNNKTFDADEFDYEFHYSNIDFIKGDAQIYEYKLEGLDEKWHSVGHRNVAYFSQIPAGDYTFKVRLKMANGDYSQVENPFSFSQKEYWYKTGWAYFGFVVFSVLLVVLIFQLRLKNIKIQKADLLNKVEKRTAQLKELNEDLENKVKQRTQKIAEFNDILAASEERYRYAIEASNDGIWDFNVKENKISLSPSIYTMLGYEPYEFSETREGLYNCMHPEELKNEKENSHNLFLLQIEDDTIFDEYRMITKNGGVVWIQVKGKVVERDENDKPLRIVGIHVDVTNEKLKNQEMLEAVLRTEDAERSRISKDIHDGLQQTLTISLLNFQSVKKEIGDLSDKSKEKFELGWKYLQDSITDSREVAHTLMPKAIVDFGIVPAFQSLIDGIDKAKEDTTFHFYHNLENIKLPNQQIEITLYRILQEAINNINKYSKATKVDIQLKEYNDIYMLTVEDNGVGFDTNILNNERKGLGIKSMKNRLDVINGFLEIDSKIGRGTSILVEINKI